VKDGHTLQLTNTSRKAPLTISLHLSDPSARTALLDPVTGGAFVLRQEADASYRLALAPTQTWILCFGEFARHFVFDGVYKAGQN
jgi:hypothetical protein